MKHLHFPPDDRFKVILASSIFQQVDFENFLDLFDLPDTYYSWYVLYSSSRVYQVLFIFLSFLSCKIGGYYSAKLSQAILINKVLGQSSLRK